MGTPVREHGVWVQDAVAPAYSTLRPINRLTGSFPVFPNLQHDLLHPSKRVNASTTHPDWTVGQTLATCAGYAYSDAETVSTMMARLGLENNRCRMIGEYVDAMFIQSTAFVVQSEDGRVVILAYRGTQPANVINWLADLDVHPDTVELPFNGQLGNYKVHAGFYRNTRATRYAVAQTLQNAKNGQAVTTSISSKNETAIGPMERLYVTGHSLGAAMGALFSVLMKTEKQYWQEFGDVYQASYLFAAPMVGNPQLASACNGDPVLRDNTIRFIYQKDPVPHLPPKVTGPFANFGQEYHFGGNKRWSHRTPRQQAGQMYRGIELLGANVAAIIRQVPSLGWVPTVYQMDDHDPRHYIRALTAKGEETEFGDYEYTR